MYLHILCAIMKYVVGLYRFQWQNALNCSHVVRHMTISFRDNVSIVSHDV